MATAAEALEMATMLRQQAEKSIAFSQAHGTQDGHNAEYAVVSLKIYRTVKGDRTRLWGAQGGPVGKVVGSTPDGTTVAMFNAHEILAAAAKLETAATEMTPPPPTADRAATEGER